MSPQPSPPESPSLIDNVPVRTYTEFKTECLKCKRCRLADTRTQVVVDDGPAPCDLMLIGEGPGADEDAQGIPFVGRSGQLLTKILETVDIKRPKDVYITNVVKCRPPGNRAPEPDEEAHCRPWLEEQIKLIKPRIIVLVGAVAMKALLGREKAISQMRGTWTQYNGIDTTIIFHPSYLLRYPSPEKGKPKWLTWQDMKAVKNALELYRSANG